MKAEVFHQKITEIVRTYSSIDSKINSAYSLFLNFLDKINADNSMVDEVKMTRMTVLFEGFYRIIAPDLNLHKLLLAVRLERWHAHYGTPTITFLLTYQADIEKTQFALLEAAQYSSDCDKPWNITISSRYVTDTANSVVVNPESTLGVSTPSEPETTGKFTKTHNPTGGFTTTPCDPVSQEFIRYASEVATTKGVVLEIGAGFGAASLEALAKGATVFCNDIEAKNLAVIQNRFFQNNLQRQRNASGDDSQLVLIPGSFPDELSSLPKNYFDAILICRVLHFFTGNQIEASLAQLLQYLKPNGKLFIVCETPFLKNWQKFIPEHEIRVQQAIKWPGEITNPAEFESSGRAASLPKFVHWITKEVLERCLKEATFDNNHVFYINRMNMFPDDLLLDGRESVGAVATKSL